MTAKVSTSEARDTWAAFKDPSEADNKARKLLDQRNFTPQAMEELLTLVIFRGTGTRDVLICKRKDAGALAFGLYAHGNMFGITRATLEMPNFVKYINAWFCSKFPKKATEIPGVSWTSFSINVNMASKLHRDCHNLIESHNVVATFGIFQGGGLWLELPPGVDPQSVPDVKWKIRKGVKVPRRVMEVYHEPTLFDPKTTHGTMPWTGKRISVTLYTARSAPDMDMNIVSQLQGLGFPG